MTEFLSSVHNSVNSVVKKLYNRRLKQFNRTFVGVYFGFNSEWDCEFIFNMSDYFSRNCGLLEWLNMVSPNVF
jgi:hypothetical protein